MGSALAVGAALIVVAIVAWLLFSAGVFAKSAEAGHASAEGEAPPGDELRYEVPAGQDPAAVVTALSKRDYDARVDHGGARRVVVVACPRGTAHDREAVRSVIASADTKVHDGVPLRGTVRFQDEPAE